MNLKLKLGAVFLFLLLISAGCASGPLGRLMPHIESMSLAESYFGPPSSSVPVQGGVEHEWLLDDEASVPGQEVTERFLVGNDAQGFPVYYERTRWVPAHRERRFCRLRMLADAQGNILSRSMEGNDCAELLKRPSTY
ncbi:MAG: hypothetical protein LBQ51_10365 [Desulfovibrio sp.]|jgi:hypothetical protein|nr:hypothetical protein [Desulfovibrio sp.]